MLRSLRRIGHFLQSHRYKATMIVSYDLLVLIFGAVQDCSTTQALCQYALVNKAFNEVASKLLYRRVVLRPQNTKVLNLRERNQPLNGLFTCALRPHYAAYVTTLEIKGFLSERPPPLNNFSIVLRNAIQTWTYLQTIILTPAKCHPDLFTEALMAMKNCKFIRNLHVNSMCCDELRAPLLVQIENLESLAIASPTRIILQLLPTWLSRLRQKLRTLHLKDNCGSVTPGVLKAIVSYLADIRSFGLGLSFSVTNDDAFAFLNQLPALTSLEFRYYLQMRKPSVKANLLCLKNVTIYHEDISTCMEADNLAKWIRYLTTRSSLQSLTLISEHRPTGGGLNVGFDGLAMHLGHRHHDTLRVLKIGTVYISAKAFERLCSQCTALEDLSVGTSVAVLDQLEMIMVHCPNLRAIDISTRNIKVGKLKKILEPGEVASFMRNGPTYLRHVIINGTEWESNWVTNFDGQIELSTQEVPKRCY